MREDLVPKPDALPEDKFWVEDDSGSGLGRVIEGSSPSEAARRVAALWDDGDWSDRIVLFVHDDEGKRWSVRIAVETTTEYRPYSVTEAPE